MKIIKSSAKAKNIKLTSNKLKDWIKQLKIGQSLLLDFADYKEQTLRNNATKLNKQGNAIYRVIKHDDVQKFEFARVG